MILNPGRRRLKGGETGIVIGTSQGAVDAALAQEFSAAEPLEDVLDNLASTSDLQPSALRTLSDFSEVGSPSMFPAYTQAGQGWNMSASCFDCVLSCYKYSEQLELSKVLVLCAI